MWKYDCNLFDRQMSFDHCVIKNYTWLVFAYGLLLSSVLVDL